MSRDAGGPTGAALWRSVDDLVDAPEFARRVAARFPALADPAIGVVDRRRLLQLMAASLALGGLSACGPSSPADEAVPYVETPPGVVPGEKRAFASALTREGYAVGVIVQHRTGRPINLEGNPDHPASLGGIDPISQAAILDLYDPDRSSAALSGGQISTPAALIGALSQQLAAMRRRGGEGLRILTERVTSPTLATQLAALHKSLPGLRWHRWDGGFRDAVRAGSELAFGRPLEAIAHLDKADIVLAVDSDLLDAAPGHLAYARALGRRQRAAESGGEPVRLYAIESTPTLTGANAEHRFIVGPGRIEAVMRAIAARLGGAGEMPAAAPWLGPLVQDLVAHKGRAMVHVGPQQPPAVHAIAHSINAMLGAPGRTLSYVEPIEAEPVDQLASLTTLAADMRAGRVDTLIVLGGNPVFTAPADLSFAEALAQVGFSLHVGTHVNETSVRSAWHLPEAHELERWGDARAFDGTVTIQQPQLRPLYRGWSPNEVLALLSGDLRPNGFALVRAAWQATAKQHGVGDFEAFWSEAVRSGVVPESRAAVVEATATTVSAPAAPPTEGGLVALFRPDPWLRDGRNANNGWLQELPRPLTKLTWDNAVLIAPETAAQRGLRDGTLVELTTTAGRVRAPILIVPGQAVDCLTLLLGFGRRTVGRVGRDTGFDPFPLRASATLWQSPVELASRDGSRALATTQGHDRMEGRDLVHTGTVAAFREKPAALSDPRKPAPGETLYPEFAYPGNAWGMAINLGSCIGCGACTAACQAENNIPVVGKEEVLRAREMHWIRVDRYYRGSDQAPQFLFQPVPCMHCENAPCEVVCPVDATMHDNDGLNVMVYNRCVGTRFCSNNCPYKVRRFNFFDYAAKDPRLDVAWNPDLSVRARGVMEKCTYCIQRIREAKIAAHRAGRNIRDGEVVTACQAACPTEAIVFGDLNDPESEVRRRKASPLDYALLGDRNTRPRTTYQSRLFNPNPAVEPEAGSTDKT